MQLAGATNKGLRGGCVCSAKRTAKGEPVRADHVAVKRWLDGTTRQPHPRTCQLIARVLGEMLGRVVTLEEIGYDEPVSGDVGLDYPEEVAQSVAALGAITELELRMPNQVGPLAVVPEAWSGVRAALADGRRLRGVQAARRTAADHRRRRRGRARGNGHVQQLRLQVRRWPAEVARRVVPGHRGPAEHPAHLTARPNGPRVLPRSRRAHPAGRMDGVRHGRARTRAALPDSGVPPGQGGRGQGAVRPHPGGHVASSELPRPLPARGRPGPGGVQGRERTRDSDDHGAVPRDGGAGAWRRWARRADTSAALLTAERWHGQGRRRTIPSGSSYFDSAELHAEFAHCFRDLGNGELASHHAAASLREAGSVYVRSTSFVRSVLSTAHLLSGELNRRSPKRASVVETAARLKSFRVLSYLDEFRGRLDGLCGGPVGSASSLSSRQHLLPSERLPSVEALDRRVDR